MEACTRLGFGVLGRRLLGALLLVSLGPLIITNTIGFMKSRSVFEDLAAENVSKTAQLYASGIDDFLGSQRALLVERVHEAGGLNQTSLNRLVADASHIDAAAFITPSGQAVISAGAVARAELLDACRTLHHDPSSAMVHSGKEDEYQVAIGVPEEGGGLLCARVSFTLHQDMLTARADSFVGAKGYILDRAGEVVCHAFNEEEEHIPTGRQVQGPARRVAQLGAPWMGVFDTPSGRHFGAFAPARSLPWGVWLELPTALATQAMRPLLQQTLALGLLFTVILTVGVMLSVRRVAHPLQALVSATGAIAEGRYGDTIPAKGGDEISLLAHAFNRMSVALRESYSELDHRVAQRTRDLAEARDFSDLLLDTVDHCILVIDQGGVISRANRPSLKAYGDDVVGRPFAALHGHDDPVRAVLSDGEPYGAEGMRELAGQTRILRFEWCPLRANGDGVSAVVEIARDVTEDRKRQLQLLHQERMAAFGTLAAGLAHEIGNPLASLSSELQLLEAVDDPAMMRSSLPVLRDQIRRISGLLRELVDFSRQPRQIDELLSAGQLFEQVVRLLRHDPRCRGVQISTELDPNLVPFASHRDRLLQVLLNLGLNALDALDGAGNLRFVAERRGDGLALHVQDDGPGVSKDVAKRIFEPFFTTKPPGKGTGLGLFVSERIITDLGGELQLGDHDAGGCFIIWLPGVLAMELMDE